MSRETRLYCTGDPNEWHDCLATHFAESTGEQVFSPENESHDSHATHSPANKNRFALILECQSAIYLLLGAERYL